MFLWSVVVHCRHVTESLNRTRDQISLSRMQVATRRVDPERPACVTRTLPCRYRQTIVKELGDAPCVHRRGLDSTLNKNVIVQRFVRRNNSFKRHQPSPFIPAKRARLSRPIQIARPLGITFRPVFRGLVILEKFLQWITRNFGELLQQTGPSDCNSEGVPIIFRSSFTKISSSNNPTNWNG